MSERYFCENPLTSETVYLTGPEAHHLAGVMRAAAGDRITLFNGAGIECEASILRLSKREVELRIEHRQAADREATRNLTLAVALPKGDRQKWLIEKAVELGVSRLIPMVTERSVVRLKANGTNVRGISAHHAGRRSSNSCPPRGGESAFALGRSARSQRDGTYRP